MLNLSNYKDPTPWQIALLSSTLISISVVACIFLFTMLTGVNFPWYTIIVIGLITLYVGYIILINALEIFIYRKIKTIYKAITKSRYTKYKVASLMDLDTDIIQEVQREVLLTNEIEQIELKQLKGLEEYRKQFLGNVSHELKTPIFNIQGYLETLIEGGIEDASIKKTYLEKALKNVDRLNIIVQDLNLISEIEDKKLRLDITKFNIWELVRDTIDSFAFMAKKSEIELSIKKNFKNPLYVSGDKERIRQILVNLISNAIRYNSPKGKVVVGAYDMDEKILIDISDTGIGIDKEHLPRIFDRFYRADKARSREKGGTGLGLSIVKHIIEAHEQSINVRSTLGEGSTFSFTLNKA